MDSDKIKFKDLLSGLKVLSELMGDYSSYNHKGIFSRKVELNYQMESNSPWINFNYPKGEIYSFRIHELEFAELSSKNKDRTMRWQGIAQKGEPLLFEGFEHIFYKRGIGCLRGKLSTEKGDELYLKIKDGRMLEYKLREDFLCNSLLVIMSMIGEKAQNKIKQGFLKVQN